jgi:hypothetical protein
MKSAREKVAEWLDNNPDKWLEQSFISIGKECDLTATSVDRHLPELIAERDGILPSEVMRQRKEAGLGFPGRSKSDYDEIRKVIEENPNADIRDIAFLAKCNPRAVKRVMDTIKQELEGNRHTDNGGEISGIDTEIEKLIARRDKLSKV